MSDNYIVAICTLGENPNLLQCVSKLLEIKSATNYQLRILVVINRDKSEFVFDSRVQVVFEPNRGYSNVRNRAIDFIPEDFHLIFIDDDEIPTRTWFEALVISNRNFPADVICGPVLAESTVETISYRDKFKSKFDLLRDGAIVKQAGAGNMLIPSHLLKNKLVQFDTFFNESGSEDTDLCFKLRKKGVKIRYSKNAKIFELQNRERMTTEYIHFRELKDICNYSLVIRRNYGVIGISWRFLTLSIRVLWYATPSFHRYKHNFYRTVYFKSLQTLIRGHRG
jgi:succinoglycan biosynthesis protein ExoM